MDELKVFSVNHIDLCVNYYNGLGYKDPKKMFQMRQEYAKKYSMTLFNKEYKDMTLEEKFNITYLTTNTNIMSSLKDFILESGFRNFFKNKRDDVEKYRILDPIKYMFPYKPLLKEFDYRYNVRMGKKNFMKTVYFLEKNLNFNFMYKIYNQSIKNPMNVVSEDVLLKFHKMLLDISNKEIITKLENKLYIHQESVSACVMINVRKNRDNDYNENWIKLKNEIKILKTLSNQTRPRIQEIIFKTFQKYYILPNGLQQDLLRIGVNKNYINYKVKHKILDYKKLINKDEE